MENKNETSAIIPPGEEIIRDDDFTYDGYQVVRGEFFAHVREPSITFNKHRVSLNTACLKRLPDVEYVQILVNSDESKLVVRPCGEDEKDSFVWCSQSKHRKPKQIICRVFYAMMMELMNWNPDYRYRILGKLIQSGNEFLFVFDLLSTEIYQKTIIEGGKERISRTPTFPAEWHNQFGLPVEEHRKRLRVDIFKGYTVFSIKNNNDEEPPVNANILPVTEERHEQ